MRIWVALLSAVTKATSFRSMTNPSIVYPAHDLLSRGGDATVLAVDPDLAIKCDSSKSLQYEAERLQLFPATASLFIDLAVPTRTGFPKHPCIVMRRLGPSLESVREDSGVEPWSWTTLASIGMILVDILEGFHSRGFVHTDLHPGNLLMELDDPSKLYPIDLGDLHPAVSDSRNSAIGYVLEDLRQAFVSLRFLLDGQRRFFAAKRFKYDAPGKLLITSGTPEAYTSLLDYVYNRRILEEVDYDYLRSQLNILADAPLDQGRIVW